MYIKKIIPLFLAAILVSTNILTLQASEIDNIPTITPVISTISEDQVPANVIPLEFDSEEELDAYLKILGEQIAEIEITQPVELNYVMGRATNGNVTIGTTYAASGTISLCINYGTTLDASRGEISYISLYTTLTGYTFGLAWNQQDIGYTISSNKKNAYVYTSGTLDQYATLTGGTGFGSVKVASYSVNISGDAYLVR